MRFNIKSTLKKFGIIRLFVMFFASLGLVMVLGFSLLVGGVVVSGIVDQNTIKHDGTRSGPRVEYDDFCNGGKVMIHENEKISFTTNDGQNVLWTQEDIECYKRKNAIENFSSPLPSTNVKVATADPLITCNINANCGGGTKQLKATLCSQSTCCQLKSGWVFYESATQCKIDQAAEYAEIAKVPSYVAPQTVSCTIYYPGLNRSETYQFSQADCNYWRSLASSGGANYYPPVATPIPTVDPQLVIDHQNACNDAVKAWDEYKAEFMQTRYNNYNSSVEAIMALDADRQYYQQQLNNAGCNKYISLY